MQLRFISIGSDLVGGIYNKISRNMIIVVKVEIKFGTFCKQSLLLDILAHPII